MEPCNFTSLLGFSLANMWTEVEMDTEWIGSPFGTPKSGVINEHLHAALDGITSAVEDGGGACSHVGRHCQTVLRTPALHLEGPLP